VSNKTFIDLNASIKLTEWLYKGSIPLQLSNLNYTIMNAILEMIIDKRNGMYVHALEVNDVYELESAIESLYDELVEEYGINTFIDFITSTSIYCLDPNDENVYNFNIVEFINNL